MFRKIKYKFALTLLIVSIAAAIPLSLYILNQQQKEKIESTVAIGRGNTRLLSRTMLDVFLKSGGDPASMRIDAEEAIATYKDQVELGLLFGQTMMLTQKHRGLIMATLDAEALSDVQNTAENAANTNNTKTEKPNEKNNSASAQKSTANAKAAKTDTVKQAVKHTEEEIQNFLRYEENHLGPCFHRPEKRCYNFAYASKYEKTPVVLAIMSISEDHILQPIRRLRLLIYASAAIAVLAALAIGLGASRFITGPIQALVEGVQRYSRGDLSARVQVKVQDELHTLGDAFNEMAEQIAAKIKEIEDHRDNLEVKVQERTAELRDALVQVSRLKEQQDADYYLTTFLYKPLCVNRNSSPYIATDFFLKQKKEFSFRDKKGEIGGDICITANLLFREPSGIVNRYLFATNADAMGKSIQGAGGAIVYGTAINTILASSTANNRVLETSPREWLVRMYRELHNIFLSFDGSMLVSGVFLLLNEHNGNAYYINAEHPWTILYREQKPEFIENELMLRKLGADLPGHEITVKEFSFRPGDVLFLASDGRDDIVIKEDIDGRGRVINEDERAILDIVLRAGGSMQKVVETLRNTGGFSDDVSIVRIEILGFNPEPIRVESKAEGRERSVKQLLTEIRDLIQGKNFAQAADELKKLAGHVEIENMPQYYILLSRIQLHDGQLHLARESLEKALRLGHEAAPTYKSLGNIFYRLKMKKEALEAWQRALDLNPEDAALRKLVAEVAV